MLTVAIHKSNEGVVLRCQGRIVKGDEIALLCTALAQNSSSLTLDLANVEAIDAAGVGLLVSLQASGIYTKLLNPAEPVREVLKVTHLDSVFEICESSLLPQLTAEAAAAA